MTSTPLLCTPPPPCRCPLPPHTSSPQVCKYIDIPLQHISNLVLLAMNRPPQQHTVALLRKLRDRIPGLVLRTTFISGFPGESDAAHRELVGFAKDMGFERMGAFAYSEEDGTPAAGEGMGGVRGGVLGGVSWGAVSPKS